MPAARAALQLAPSVPAACLRGLEGFSHCWVLYVFHENTGASAGRRWLSKRLWTVHQGRRQFNHLHTAQHSTATRLLPTGRAQSPVRCPQPLPVFFCARVCACRPCQAAVSPSMHSSRQGCRQQQSDQGPDQCAKAERRTDGCPGDTQSPQASADRAQHSAGKSQSCLVPGSAVDILAAPGSAADILAPAHKACTGGQPPACPGWQ